MKINTKEFTDRVVNEQPSLRLFALKLTANNVESADDLVQDTTLRALRNEEKYQEATGSFKGWMLTIMRNIFLNDCRRTAQAAIIDADLENINNINLPSGEMSPESSYSASEIATIIRRLPDENRVPFTLHIEGFKYSEIAERLGVPVSKVKANIYRTRQRLRVLLAENQEV